MAVVYERYIVVVTTDCDHKHIQHHQVTMRTKIPSQQSYVFYLIYKMVLRLALLLFSNATTIPASLPRGIRSSGLGCNSILAFMPPYGNIITGPITHCQPKSDAGSNVFHHIPHANHRARHDNDQSPPHTLQPRHNDARIENYNLYVISDSRHTPAVPRPFYFFLNARWRR